MNKNKINKPIIIKRFTAEYLDPVCNLISQISSTEDLRKLARCQFKTELETSPIKGCRVIAVHGAKIIGTMGCGPGPISSPCAVWADWLVVDEKSRRLGVASLLYEAIENYAIELDQKYICLDIGNIEFARAAFLFHQNNGFQIIGQIPDYWAAHEHLNIMVKRLKK
jgi:GNAT superfamily N-acetyltransferase